jgi:hypothetical protein
MTAGQALDDAAFQLAPSNLMLASLLDGGG